ncbi:hypothetical protein DEO72_LG10g1123 [Vigna unguiculata]|uniref:Uncharacterized protein n=1 Tax=Vigna unguiculata TaxID=3917 RepID=A0A4D6N7T8_VIGUN|nr:hypothetical protein DEO72_LG10g1123 [Vigna unguiculata]
MVRTRGAHRGGSNSSHVEASKQEPRERPIASVRRRDKGHHRKSGPSSHGEAGSSTDHGEAGPSLPTPIDIHEEQENIIHHEEVVAGQDHDTWLGQEEHIVVAQILHMLRLLSKSLGRDRLHLFVEEIRVIIERVVHHLMGKLVHQLIMEKLVHHYQLLLIFMRSKKI